VTEATWTLVDTYLESVLVPPDADLAAAQADSRAAGLPPISVSPSQGKLLHLLARSIRATRILEVGTLGGYSTIWLARALPLSGRLITLEIDPRHAAVARGNLDRAGVAGLVEVRVGRAADSLASLHQEGPEPFDLVFIDADKASNPVYFDWALRLTRPGSLIVVDNVVRGGAVVDGATDDDNVVGVRRVLEAMAAEPRIEATAVQTVGRKGYDGFALGLVVEPDPSS
jgi:predicted O-methyltransferase YrrM